MDMEFEYISNALIKLIREAMFNSKDTLEMIFKNKNEPAAIAYLSKAISKMSAAEAIYYSRFDILARDELETIFNRFEIFSNEVIECYSTNHSHQWSDIEYNRLKSAFDNSICALENN